MKKKKHMNMHRHVVIALAAFLLAPHGARAQTPVTAQNRWAAVEKVFGRKGVPQAGGVMRFSFPRSDLNVTLDGVQLKPAFALGTWIAFKETAPDTVIAMGDLVLTEQEVASVMRALQAGGVEQSALHNHVLNESPRVMYLHVAAHGNATQIAHAVTAALKTTSTPLVVAATNSAPANLDTAAIATTLGVAGRSNGGVYQISVPRNETIREGGHEVPPAMGVATAINFQPTAGGRAMIAGDFVLRPSEVNQVIRALQTSGITVTALHSHMLDESPRMMFMHFWAHDDALKLARGLGEALRHTNSNRKADR
jgi:hypothetical protein